MSQSNNTASQRKNQALVYGALISIVWIIGCTVLYVFGWLDDSVAKTVSIIGAVIAVIAVSWWASVNTTIMLRRSYLRPALASVVTIVLLAGGVVFYQRNLQPNLISTTPRGFPQTGVASYTYSSSIPFCDANPGDFWRVSLPGTALSCVNMGLVMRQATLENDAEVLLDQSGGYSAGGDYGIGVNVTFQIPSDTKTWAGVIVQSPSDYSDVGGYIFKLNSAGQWQLQHTLSNTYTAVIARGVVSVNPKLVAIRVDFPGDSKLHCYVNGKQIFAWRDGLDNPPGPIGLIVTRAHSMSSTVVYSNFIPEGDVNF